MLGEEDSAAMNAWLMSIAWSEALYFGINLFFFSIAVCWLDILYRYIRLDAFAPVEATLEEHKMIEEHKTIDDADKNPVNNNCHFVSALKRL
jgi:hypothetical protein